MGDEYSLKLIESDSEQNNEDTSIKQCLKEKKSKTPFQFYQSKYIKFHSPSSDANDLNNCIDILRVPLSEKDVNFSKSAQEMIQILDSRSEHEGFKWNFDTDIRYMNLIVYISGLSEVQNDVLIPKTAISILGTTLYELIYHAKTWVFTPGSSDPFCNTLGAGLYHAVENLKHFNNRRKRLELTGILEKDPKDIEKYFEESHMPSLSPFSNLHVILKHCGEDKKFVEKLLYNIGSYLKIPTLKLTPEIDRKNLVGFKLDFLDPFRVDTQNEGVLKIEQDLYKAILSKANDFFYGDPKNFEISEKYTGWNFVIIALLLKDDEKFTHAFMNTKLYDLENSQRERIIRYALFHGSQNVVKQVFESEYMSKEFQNISKRIVHVIFNKSAEEILMYSRLMIALNLDKSVDAKKSNNNNGENIGAKDDDIKYIQDVRDAIQKLFRKDFIFESKLEDFKEEELLCHFSAEYIMIWAVMSQKIEVAKLFLSYSGTHLQFMKKDKQYFSSTEKGVYQICNALAISWILKKMSKLLKNDSSVTRKNLDQLDEQSKSFDQIATDLLDYATKTEECNLKNLLETPSPFWAGQTALDLARNGNAYSFMKHYAVKIYLDQVWWGHDVLKQKEGDSVRILHRIFESFTHPCRKSSLLLYYYLINTPIFRFCLHGAFFLFLIICFILLIAVPELKSGKNRNFLRDVHALEWVMFTCLLGYTFGEITQYFHLVQDNFENVSRKKWKEVLKVSFYSYLSSLWNKLDIIIMFMAILSVVLRLFSLNHQTFPVFIPRLAYGFTAIPVFIRSIQYILIVDAIGPLIYTIYQGFVRMFKFLLIILLLSFAVGILQVALMKPSTTIHARFKHLIFTPFFQIFGRYSLDELANNTYGMLESNSTNGSITQFWERSNWILFLVVAIWVLIINVLIINIMIAYFTKIYEKVEDNAKSIYIWQFIEIVEEYKGIGRILTPPFNLFFGFYFILRFINCRRSRVQKEETKLIDLVKEEEMISNQVTVYFAKHYENTFADRFWAFRRYKKKPQENEEEK